MRIIFFFVCFLYSYSSAIGAGEFVLSNQIISAYSDATRFDLIASRHALDIDRKSNPGNGFAYLIANYADFIQVFVGDDPIEYRQALARRTQRIRNLEVCDDRSPYKRYCLAEIYIQWTFLRFQQGEQTKAANDLRKAASLLHENNRLFPSFILNKKGLAIIHILAGSIPDNMQWLAKLAGISGSVNQGIEELNFVLNWARSGKEFQFIIPELLFFKQLLSIQLLDDKAIRLISQTSDSLFAKEPLLKYVDIIHAQKSQNALLVIELIDHFPKSITGVKLCFLDYLKAEARMNLELSDQNGFRQFIQCSAGKHFKQAAIRKIAWQNLLLGKPREYFNYMESIKLLGKPTTEEDKQAVIEANTGKVPDLILLKSRLLFDGGQAGIAINDLLKIELKNRDIIFLSERAYRLGRCYHWLGNENEALKWYEITIQKGELLSEYFAASASYQTGKILTQQKRFKEAKEAFLRVSQFPEHPYKGSIDAKAKTALKQLKSN
ncbi:MAG TPA: hypothetical protein PL185_11590 [Flavobacteriales bacterium]|nr:hypothetical protein [Flavobacteriales bacterium]